MRQLMLILVICYFGTSLTCDDKIDLEKAIKDLGSDQYDTRLKAKKIFENIGVRAVPILRKAITSDDLEIKEFAEKITSELITYQDERFKIEKMLGTENKIISSQKFYVEYSVWLKDFFLSSYEKNSTKNQKWDAPLRKLTKMWLEYFVGLALETEISDIYHAGRSARNNEMEIRKLINDLATLECNDQLFLFLRSALYFVWNDHRNTPEESVKIRDIFLKSNYSNYFKFYAAIRAKWSNPAVYLGDNKRPEDILESYQIFKLWLEMGKEEAFKNRLAQRRYVQWANDFWNDINYNDVEKNLEKISENFGLDSWVDHAIKAKFHLKKAWAARNQQVEGNGLNESSFELNLIEGQNHAIAAYQLIPEFLEPLTDLIEIKATSQTGDVLRPWFEKGAKAEINNNLLFTNYVWYLSPQSGGSYEDMLSLGREFLVVDNPKVNLAKFYMSTIKSIIDNDFNVYGLPGVLSEVEWAVEQQVAFKTIYSNLYYNDLVMAAFYTKDFQKTLKAIQGTKGFFSAGWYPIHINSGFIENYAMLVEKYKNKPIGGVLKALPIKNFQKYANSTVDPDADGINNFAENIVEKKQEDDSNRYENCNKILDQLNNDFEPIDRPKLVSALMNFNCLGGGSIRVSSLDSLHEFGYREINLVSNMFLSNTDEKLKTKLIEAFGAKTLEAQSLADSKGTTDYFQIEIAEKIKAIFVKGIPNEKDLEKNDEYNKAQLRACSSNYNQGIVVKEHVERITPYIKNLQNIGDACDFIFAHIYTGGQYVVKWSMLEAFQKEVLYGADRNIDFIDQEIKRLSNIENDKNLAEEVQKTWFAKGSPVLMLEIAKLLKERKLLVEAEKVHAWSIYCLEGFNIGKEYHAEASEALLQTLSIYPGNHKEAYQMGMSVVKAETSNVNHYLMAYHIFKLGNYHMAYELLCRGQKLRSHNGAIIFNKIEYIKSDDLLQAVFNEMLVSKELPEYIRFNLKDQFDVKFKK